MIPALRLRSSSSRLLQAHRSTPTTSLLWSGGGSRPLSLLAAASSSSPSSSISNTGYPSREEPSQRLPQQYAPFHHHGHGYSAIQHRWLATGGTDTSSKEEQEKKEEQESKPQTEQTDNADDSSSSSSDSDSDSSDSDSDNDTAAAPPPKKVNAESMEFQAETKQLLDIVTNSLYTDKDVFLRELISNASDALEKLRHVQATNTASTIDSDVPLEIRIDLNEVDSTITITDTGIGMTRDEMISNLGTIARSGSKNFLQELQMQQEAPVANDISRGIIGKFGVGFYAAFMVGHLVEVRSKSALTEHSTVTPKVWSSDNGAGSFEIFDLDDNIRQDRGSSIVIHLKEEFWQYCDENKIEEILKRYSNFVNFPIFLNGNRVNTIDAVWVKDPKEVDDETYADFYKYISNNMDDPLETIHFRADAPLDVKALFFIPSFHSEKYGMGRMEPGVSLYSRKVLIEAKSPDILPDWMRFVKGVVDSEDLPLAISREKAQDSALIAKLRSALVRKFISHITKLAKKDRSRFVDEFYKEYAFFLKEGICHDFEFQEPLSKLLYFETSKNQNSELSSLDEYIGRVRPEQKDVYYLCAPSRDAALNSPYLEAFEKADVEVLFMYSAIEDFVMANLEKYQGRNLVSVETSDIDLSELTKQSGKDDEESEDADDKDEANVYNADRKLTPEEALDFCLWFKKELGDKKISSCTVTDRLHSSPAIVTDHESGALRRMMRYVDTQDGNRDYIPLPKQHVEINPSHKVIVGIHAVMKTQPALARVLAEQVYDNCLIAAGLLDDSRAMLPRLNDIMMCVVNGATGTDESVQSGSTSPGKDETASTNISVDDGKAEESAKEESLVSEDSSSSPKSAASDGKP
ncbi:protein HtpG [Seminavis robusta]|uniref:Protein HtpG n=1 Tax=Seminavis robusta TaxID=568900 RepID=A0A9N8DCM5_9STRA|nr:protein HtpG [Seminavis robusta]|eukprot:Sro30_g019920.1 protein HtpG (862) ;mRNA; r:154830-157871